MHSPDSGEKEVISLTMGQGWHSPFAAVNTKFFCNASLPALYHRFPDIFISTLGQKPFDVGAFNGLCFPCGSAGKESTCSMGDLGSIPGLGRSPEGGHDNPLKYSCLENPHGQKSLAGYSPWGCKDVWATKHNVFLFIDVITLWIDAFL